MNPIKIYMFDNSTGMDIPEKIDVYPVELLLGKTVSEIHESMSKCTLFCIFTPISDADIVVQSEDDLRMMKNVTEFAKRDYNIICRESSIWYSNKADTNVIFSNTIDLSSSELSSLIKMYLNEIVVKQKAEGKITDPETYIVINTRNSNVLIRTSLYDEAKRVCDKNPSCVIVNKKGLVLYKSSFGKIPASFNKGNFSEVYRAKQKKNNIFGIKFNI